MIPTRPAPTAALASPVDHAWTLATAHIAELGYVRRAELVRAQQRGELAVTPHGYAQMWHRRDGTTTIQAICVDTSWQRKGEGASLLAQVYAAARAHGQTRIAVRCPETLPANLFFEGMGFTRHAQERRRSGRMNVWQTGL